MQKSATPSRVKPYLYAMLVVLGLALVPVYMRGCFKKQSRDRSETYAQKIEESKTKTDNLRKAMRFLAQMTPSTRDNFIKEVQLELNTWLKDVDYTRADYSLPQLLRPLPTELLAVVGCENPLALTFNYWDIDFLYERRLMNQLSGWVTGFPLRDNLVGPIVERQKQSLSPEDGQKLEEACKLFDWTVRNIMLDPSSSSVEEMYDDPQSLAAQDTLGCGYLPWESLLFSSGDFVERGRVFNALAEQRGIDSFWISVGADATQPGKLWAIGVALGDRIFLFEPKLGMPILDPDNPQLATLAEALSNERILRRLDLPGQFDYALERAELVSLKFLLDAQPVAASVRMKLLESVLLGDERMTLYRDIDALQRRLAEVQSDVTVELWRVPLLSQIHAGQVREMLDSPSEAMRAYMGFHGVWLTENSAANGRLKHLVGKFENTDDSQGALDLYMDSRIDDKRIAQLSYDPDVQRELGIVRGRGERMEEFEYRIAATQQILSRAKVDAAYLLAQLHFDRGNYSASAGFLRRIVDSSFAEYWHPGAWYTRARISQELGELEQASEALTHQPNDPQEAGNRLRLRYLRRTVDGE